MKPPVRSILAMLLFTLLAACGNLSSLTTGDRYWLRPGMGRPSNDAVSLLHYFDYVRTLSATEQDQEQDRQRKAWVKDKSDFRRIQYALALSSPAASTADRRLSAQLLEPIAREAKGHDAELHLLAEVLFRNEESERKLEAVKDIERNLLQRERGQDKGMEKGQGGKP